MAVSVVILAAGKGTRMRSKLPKVLHKICGQEMLVHVLEVAFGLSDDVHVILHHEYELISQVIEKYFKNRPTIHLQNATQYPGTGGALMQEDKNPLKTAHNRLLVLNADMPLVSKEALLPFVESKESNALGVFSLESKSGYGRVCLQNNQVQAIIEEKDASAEILALNTLNAGVYLFSQECLQEFLPRLDQNNAQAEYYLTQLVSLGVQKGVRFDPIFVNAHDFLGVNSQSELATAEGKMLDKLREQAMQAGVCMHMPHTIYLEKEVRFGEGCVLEQGVHLAGDCYLQEAHIRAHSVVESSHIENSSIGPLAHIRPNSKIVNSHVGNFVETKSAYLNGVKAGHLSYLGDCSIASGSNVGAGVITCNYDGRAKHHTKIGHNVFIGSDSQLVAPLNIPDNVLIAAGSTITEPIQEGDLVLVRPPQVSIPRGYFKFFKKP
ncbi:bifunctional UDP-N-acetylglucosamine diphosphorylase/glucosamine-1-phosphate N-acetyltransferase GlmU [Helicobacter heilmannii]|uniref:bifunctional UDP-N-acetylglucosamine diphosphorylase/glucosamine-1-phosphate N-acetyltransferase GlmU n=1 Tax=Helicobacter heilmannii TaxID=35817 RepID=UPI0006A207BF|nr:bifunctional UDP-N-acetylglucosamine diphosphorylase/glucosamine-1-phosphate N-acetyltransferase GlmU [Helicobacter heilmannii]GMB95310.1 Bifunctional N-acetylglucosamine-1-phosphate uridyltransferase [Helicobacter heilmannii]CRF51291.1 N-acetylglucosamine-1-phosphate uridyltransferase / Glucosamine-1-phosphate N-acetyltransferase [Helicobacter heilmannii]